MKNKFFTWLMLFSYRQSAKPNGNKFGVPGTRDPDSICESYAPRKPLTGDFTDCQTDGHYLCRKCAHRDLTPASA